MKCEQTWFLVCIRIFLILRIKCSGLTFTSYFTALAMSTSAECRHCCRSPVGKPNSNSEGARISRFDVDSIKLLRLFSSTDLGCCVGGFGAWRFFRWFGRFSTTPSLLSCDDIDSDDRCEELVLFATSCNTKKIDYLIWRRIQVANWYKSKRFAEEEPKKERKEHLHLSIWWVFQVIFRYFWAVWLQPNTVFAFDDQFYWFPAPPAVQFPKCDLSAPYRCTDVFCNVITQTAESRHYYYERISREWRCERWKRGVSKRLKSSGHKNSELKKIDKTNQMKRKKLRTIFYRKTSAYWVSRMLTSQSLTLSVPLASSLFTPFACFGIVL